MWRLMISLLLSVATFGQTNHPILAIGSPAPDFSLPGVDGKIHKLSDYAASAVLVVVFTCNHCPIAQMYEQRIQQLEQDYRGHGVAVVAIHPNDPKAIRIDELDSSDMSDRTFLNISSDAKVVEASACNADLSGFESHRHLHLKNLSPARLPVPPLRRGF